MLLGGRCHSSGNTVTFYLRNGYSQCTQFLYRVHELAITFYPAVLEFEGMDVVVLAIALRIPRDQRLAAPVALDPEVVRILGLEDGAWPIAGRLTHGERPPVQRRAQRRI